MDISLLYGISYNNDTKIQPFTLRIFISISRCISTFCWNKKRNNYKNDTNK